MFHVEQKKVNQMASYTMELRNYIEMWTQETEDLSYAERIEVGRTKLFDFPYPVWNDQYKKEFETKFIRNFYMREIGFETEQLFKMRLENWLAINMPYYNQLLESELLQDGYNPLTNSKTEVKHNRKNQREQDDLRNRMQNVGESETTDQTATMNEDSSFNTDEKAEVNRTLDRTQNTEDVGNSETDSTRSENENTDGSSESFDRKLTDQTPDGRLGITANDGTGVINYASEIEENRNTGTTEGSRDVTGSEASETSTTNSQDVTGKDTEKVNSDTNTNGVSETDTSTQSNIDREMNRDTTDRDTLDREVRDNEDFLENREGKIGVVSFAKLLMQHRQTFLRVEKEMFREMQVLFMGIY